MTENKTFTVELTNEEINSIMKAVCDSAYEYKEKKMHEEHDKMEAAFVKLFTAWRDNR